MRTGSPFPLPSLLPACTVILDRSAFGRDEVDAFLNGPAHVPAQFEAALYVAVDGFTANQLGITTASFSGTPNVAPSFAFAPGLPSLSVTTTSLSAPDQGALDVIQRFTWVCRVTFTSDADFPTTPGGTIPVTLTAAISSVAGSADILLVDEPNPYELDGPTSWLSTDLRVFQIRAGDTRFGETMGGAPGDAPTFIQNVIGRLNAGNTAGDTFDAISTDETTSALELSEQVSGVRVFNYAVAKVRLRSLAADANNVRVFFRLFPAATTSTAYDAATTYRRGGSGGVTVPLLGLVGGETTSIPCFAGPRIDTSAQGMDTQTDPANVRTMVHDGSGAEIIAYFGCWLDINQPSQPEFPIAPPAPVDGPYVAGRQTIQDLVRNAHQCLTAEIDLDGVTLLHTGDSPGSSDKLAQRNLSIVASDNPGAPASHRIPNTFDIKPSRKTDKPGSDLDELLIDWGNTPAGSEATLYLPQVGARAIVDLANRRYVRHRLSALDDSTLHCFTGGVTYVPIPPGNGPNYAGLLTIDLPPTVRKGEVYTIVARQIGDAFGPRIQPPELIGTDTGPQAIAGQGIRWRKVQGSFQLTIRSVPRRCCSHPRNDCWASSNGSAARSPTAIVGRRCSSATSASSPIACGPSAAIRMPSSPRPAVAASPIPHLSIGSHSLGRSLRLPMTDMATLPALRSTPRMASDISGVSDMRWSSLVVRVWTEQIRIRVTVEEDNRHRPEKITLLQPPRHRGEPGAGPVHPGQCLIGAMRGQPVRDGTRPQPSSGGPVEATVQTAACQRF